ncbi:hypothetical protein [Corallococcus carmarthensis]|uniref:Acyl carrier protein n=1 Tax=Corallococcus carmarthensis TaxID=2316728 RepID=A0A3A8KHE5_9BACT|nr:hypothetical protein [Corallococcus carmarthensis]NOK15688.1 hypothetical protein [Corallococcus carmarthensis]RKH07390.1 hypothetical protein D7X32_02140 [Corallococcus carmarthensis]
MTREEFQANIIQYLATQASLPEGWSCGPKENLFDLGVLESFDLPRLVAHIERMLDRRADLKSRRSEVFFTLDTMYEAFVGASKEGSCAP